MKLAYGVLLAALPMRQAYVFPSRPAPWYGTRDTKTIVPSREAGTTRLQMARLFDEELSREFPAKPSRTVQRCNELLPVESQLTPDPPKPNRLLDVVTGEHVDKLVFHAVPPLGRNSLDTTLHLCLQVYYEDFRKAAAATPSHFPLTTDLAGPVQNKNQLPTLYCRTVNDFMMITRSMEREPDGGGYIHTRVIFRGTVLADSRDRSVDWRSNRPRQVRLPLGSEDGTPVTIGEGWIDRYVELAPKIVEIINEDEQFAKNVGVPHVVTFAGHSLGGSVSILAGMDHAERQKAIGSSGESARIVALSPARVGFLGAFDDLLLSMQQEDRIRGVQIRHSWDGVSAVPFGANEPQLPLVEIRGAAPTPLQARDNHRLELLTDRLYMLLDQGEIKAETLQSKPTSPDDPS